MALKVVLLEHPRLESEAHYNDVANAPLHACLMSGYIAALLQQHGCEVAIHDAYLSGDSFEQTFHKLSVTDAVLLGVHAVYFWEHTSELFSLLGRLKTARPEMYLILYGVFPTFACGELLQRYSFIDGIITGEPEQTFLEITRLVEAGKGIAARPVEGFACRVDNSITLHKPRALLDPLDRLPFPVRHRESLEIIGGSLLGSRGCYGNCTFCCINPFYGPQPCWRGRTPGNIAAEIAALLPLLEKKYIYFLDANFFGKGRSGKQRALAIAGRIKEYSLRFGLESRCSDIDARTLKKLVDAGLQDVFLGIESGSPASLARMKKRIGIEKAKAALRLLREYDVAVTPGFIMFEADATLPDIRDNFEFLKNQGLLTKLSHTANVLYHREIAFSGMKNFMRLKNQKRLLGKDRLGYEGIYRFSDPAVGFLADVMSIVCRRVLKIMEHNQASICWRNGDNRVTDKINEYLVKSFEYALGRLLLHELPVDEETKQALQEKAINYIEGLIVEERVCQA